MATWKEKFNKKYNHPKGTSHSLSDVSKETGVSKKGIQQIYNKGIGAYKTNPQSVRPNVTSKEQWAMARVYSSVMGGKASKVDAKELKMQMGGSLDNKQLITKVVLTDFDKKGFFGQYKKVFDAFNKEYSLGFVDGAYELDSSGNRDSNGNYILLVSDDLSGDVQERLSKIKGISFEEIFIDKNMFEMGGSTDDFDRTDFYKGYYERLSPSNFVVEKENEKITINMNDRYKSGGRIFPQQAVMHDGVDEVDAIANGMFEKGGETDFNPDGKIKDKIVHASGDAGGMLVGKRHSNGGIKAINKSTGQPLEMEGGEVVITRDAVSDNKKRSFNGKMMTNRQILSAINESGGGVSFADGGQVPNDLQFDCNAEYEYGGKTMCGKDLAYALGGVTTAIVTDPNEAMADLQSTYGLGDVYAKGGEVKWIKNIDEEFGWNENPFDHIGGYISEDGDYKIYQEGKWVTRDFGETFIRKGDWTVDYKDKPIGYGSSERMYLSNLKDAKEFVSQINNEKFAKGGTIECGSCDWSWDIKDGGDDMYVCHRCGTDNEKYFSKDNSFEEGGFVKGTSSTEVIGMLNDIFAFPLKSGSGANQVMITKSEPPYESLSIQFGRAKAQPLSNGVVEQLFYPLGTNTIDKVTVESDSYRSVVPLTEIFSITELINFFDDKNDGQYYFRFYSNNIQIVGSTIKIGGRKRKPTGWKKGYYFGLKDIKKNINNFLQIVQNQLPSDVGLNLTSFILGTTSNAIKNKTESDEAEKIKKEKEKKERKERELLEANVFNYEKNFSLMNEIAEKGTWKDLGFSKPFDEEKINVEKDYLKLEVNLEMLKVLLPNFQGSKDLIQRKRILKEMKKIQDKINGVGIEINETIANTNDLFTSEGLLNYYFTQSTQSPVLKLDKPCGLPTPNGEKSRLPLSAYLNVRTKEFKNWFGDWEVAYDTNNYNGCSIMIDKDTKEPKIYYHGVAKFRGVRGKGAMGSGVRRPYGAFTPTNFNASYFADNMEYAKFYSGTSDLLPTRFKTDGFVYSLFLNVRNPIDLLPLGLKCSYKNIKDYLLVAYGIELEYNNVLLEKMDNDINSVNNTWQYIRNDELLIERLKDFGYDCIFQVGDIPKYDKKTEKVIGSIEDKEFLTFYPNQVKSVGVLKSFYGNMFDDIRFKKGGYVSI